MSSGVRISSEGDFGKTLNFFDKVLRHDMVSILQKYGKAGVAALQLATPVHSALTATSWSYEITKTKSGYRIDWINTNTNGNYNIAILLQYGHGTRSGAYVQGRDYINPAMRSVVDSIVSELWTEVTN